MKHEYLHPDTQAFFSVLSLEVFQKEIYNTPRHQWFTIIIYTGGAGVLAVDDSKLNFGGAKAIFITPGQHLQITTNSNLTGYAISFNKEFYCIEYHDSDISCQGLLFVNNFNLVNFKLDTQQHTVYTNTAKEMVSEMEGNASLQEEMLKNLLKNLLIRSNRLFREQMSDGDVNDSSIDFVRRFSDLVERNFREIKEVEAYAEMLRIASSSLTKKLKKYGIDSPSKIIKNRVVTEAKRLLIYTNKSIKEIAGFLGYDDQFYFSRFFTKEVGISPSEYKKSQIKL